jgi:hypothetical protein
MIRGPGGEENMLSWRCMAEVGVLYFALIAASPSVAQPGDGVAQPDIVTFWNAAKCVGGYQSSFYSAHCVPGPSATIFDFKTKAQFFCRDIGAVDIRWAIPIDAKRGSPIPPSQLSWRPECWKEPLKLDVDPTTAVLTPQYNQSPAPNYYMTMNVMILYDATKVRIKLCLVPLFPGFPVEPACADAEIRS